MEVKQSIFSQLKQHDLYIKKIEFIREKAVPEKIVADFDVNYNYLKDNVVSVELKGEIKSENGLFFEIVLIGEFELMNYSEIPLTAAKNILEQNTVAIMFPFLRSEITIISAQPNMPSLVLPPLNINALLNDKNKKKVE